MLLRKKRRRITNVFFFHNGFLFELTTHSFWRRTYSGPRRTHEIFHVVVNYTFGKRLIKKLHLWENLGWKVFTSYSFILIYVMIKWTMILISFLVKPVERHISVCGAIGYHWERIILVSQYSQAIFTMPFFFHYQTMVHMSAAGAESWINFHVDERCFCLRHCLRAFMLRQDKLLCRLP